MLRSLSSVELSRHAVELEKRSIQLSLEEGNGIVALYVPFHNSGLRDDACLLAHYILDMGCGIRH